MFEVIKGQIRLLIGIMQNKAYLVLYQIEACDKIKLDKDLDDRKVVGGI